MERKKKKKTEEKFTTKNVPLFKQTTKRFSRIRNIRHANIHARAEKREREGD